MEALTISAANLNTIEENLGSVAKELGGVINNVNNVNDHVHEIDSKVTGLNNEVKNLVSEIRETTIITNARQNIMYNNAQIEKKFGFHDVLRRQTTSLLDAISNSNISLESIIKLREDILLNNPKYWLANAIAALTYWLQDNRDGAENEINNALKKNQEKTSLFFCLINLKLDRIDTSIRWLEKYLSIQNPMRLNKDFITVLDLVATGSFGDEEKNIVLKKIDNWIDNLNSETTLQENEVYKWEHYLNEFETSSFIYPYLDKYSTDIFKIKDNYYMSSSYKGFLNKLQSISNKEETKKDIDNIIDELIYDYESQEKIFEKENFKNNLIIECNGDMDKANEIFKKQEEIFSDEINILSLLSNIVIYRDSYNISNETQKIAIALSKNHIKKALEANNKKIVHDEYQIKINDFTTKTKDGKNGIEVLNDLNLYIEKLFDETDKDVLIILIIANILGIIGLFITINSRTLSTILIILLVLINIFFFIKLAKRTNLRNRMKDKIKNEYKLILERVLAECLDYDNVLKENIENYNLLQTYLDALKTINYIKSNEERNINIEV